jgi:hypothetical protein
VTDKHGQTVVVPEVGMTLEYEKDAYEINNTYARQIGFSNRKNDTKRRVDKSIYSKLIVCNSQGFGETSSSQSSARMGCNARIQLSVTREGIWIVHKIKTGHNHYLTSPNKKYKLRSQRHVECMNNVFKRRFW